jgi:hypothetical protein
VDHSPSSYVVDGQNGNTICGPASSNDNFDIVNCYFAYNPLDKRVKLFTNVPPGYYESITNYDTPVKSSVVLLYWSYRYFHPKLVLVVLRITSPYHLIMVVACRYLH